MVLASRPLPDNDRAVYGDAPKVYRKTNLKEKSAFKPKVYEAIPGQFSKVFMNNFDKNMDKKRELFELERKAFQDQIQWQQQYEQRLRDGTCTEKDKAMNHLIGLREGNIKGEYVNSDAVPFATRDQLEELIHKGKLAEIQHKIKITKMQQDKMIKNKGKTKDLVNKPTLTKQQEKAKIVPKILPKNVNRLPYGDVPVQQAIEL